MKDEEKLEESWIFDNFLFLTEQPEEDENESSERG